MSIMNFYFLELASTATGVTKETDQAYEEHLDAFNTYALGGITISMILGIMKSHFKIAFGFCVESFLINSWGINFVQNPVLTINALIDGFVGMMDVFVGASSMITVGMTLHHTFFAKRAIMLTETGQFNDIALYC